MNSDPLIGQQLDHYLIQQALGHGGMARVYKGIDINLKRPVAIKMIAEGLRTNATYAQRFEREAQSVANLKHPNIVTVFHFGKHDGLYYLVMEYIDGADLDIILNNYERNGELMPHQDVIRILGAVADALDYAHGQGVIHRDVKPSNIMLERDGRPVLTDFGLALRLSEGTRGDTFGSPHYISPEQARNSANAVPQSDLYSLGVIAYELLTGILPFDDPSATSLAMQHIMQPVPSPRLFNRALSEQVEQVLFRILAKEPEARFQTGNEFIAALHDSLNALKGNPPKISTAELPPMPPGLEAPAPRRLSMQTAVDKLQQEMNMVQARGQALTRYPTTSSPLEIAISHPEADNAIRKNRRQIYALAFVGILAALVAIGLFLTKFAGGAASTATVAAIVPTETPPLVAATVRVTTTLPPSSTQPPTTIPPSETSIAAAFPTSLPTTLIPSSPPPSITPTPMPPNTATLPPTTIAPLTAIPTNMPEPTSAIPPKTTIPPTVAPAVSATILYPNGKRFLLVWDDQTFYASNQSGERIGSAAFGFERIATGGTVQKFSGGRWASFYTWSENNRCLVVRRRGTSAALPCEVCPSGYNAEATAVSGELFWTVQDGSTQFRVLWNNSEIARCAIDQGRCEIHLP